MSNALMAVGATVVFVCVEVASYFAIQRVKEKTPFGRKLPEYLPNVLMGVDLVALGLVLAYICTK